MWETALDNIRERHSDMVKGVDAVDFEQLPNICRCLGPGRDLVESCNDQLVKCLIFVTEHIDETFSLVLRDHGLQVKVRCRGGVFFSGRRLRGFGAGVRQLRDDRRGKGHTCFGRLVCRWGYSLVRGYGLLYRFCRGEGSLLSEKVFGHFLEFSQGDICPVAHMTNTLEMFAQRQESLVLKKTRSGRSGMLLEPGAAERR